MRKRSIYRPKLISIPMTGLTKDFGLALHTALSSAISGHFTHTQFDRIGNVLNTIWMAMQIKPPKDAAILPVLEGCMRTIHAVGERGLKSGIWKLNEYECASLRAGVEVCERQLPKMDVTALYQARQKIVKMAQEDYERACHG